VDRIADSADPYAGCRDEGAGTADLVAGRASQMGWWYGLEPIVCVIDRAAAGTE